jgi:uncharacterized protein (TIGR02271 family)
LGKYRWKFELWNYHQFDELGENLTRVKATIGYEPEGLLEKTGDALGFPSARIEEDLTSKKEGAKRGWRGQVGKGDSTDMNVLPTRSSRLEVETEQPCADEHALSETKVSAQPRETAGESTIEVPLSEEEVKVGKRTVGAGEVKLHKTVTTETVNVPVELKREDIVVERVPAHEVEAGKGTFQEEVIRVPLSREEPVVEKEVRVTGGVRVHKTEGIDKETIQETVRREKVDVDESGKTARRETGAGQESL